MRSFRASRFLHRIGVRVAEGILALALVGSLLTPVQGQPTSYRVEDRAIPVQSVGNWKDCGLRKVDVDAFTTVRPAPRGKRSPTATIEVAYSGFSPDAREAFERAVEIWETHVKSDIAIRIDASYESLSAGVLGGTQPSFAYALDSDEDGQAEAFVLDALADALTGEDQQPDNADFSITLNSDRDDWHFGEGEAPAGQIDFTSVVLHEIAHGLGYLGITNVSEGTGQYGFDFGDGGGRIPSIYTYFLAEKQGDGSRVSLMNESEFPNPSEALADAFTGDRLVFDGTNAITTANPDTEPVPPKVYAPSNFNAGSSISHLDEFAYPQGGPNALMTPALQTAETNRLPGPVVCGQLRDMFWPLGGGCRRFLADVFALQFAESPSPSDGSVTLTWQVRDDADVEEFVVERKYFDGAFEPVRRVPFSSSSDNTLTTTLESLGLGTHAFRVRWVRSDGSEGTTARSVETTFRARNVTSEIASRGEQGRATVSLSWAVPPGTEGFTYRVERQTGVEGSFTQVASTAQTSGSVERQTPGTYRYRVSAEDESGNVVVGEEKEEVQIDFEGAVYVLGPYPNPVQQAASFDLTAREGQSVTVEVYTTTGELLYREERLLAANVPEFLSINTGQWGSGMYFLRVRGPEFVRTRRMIVVR